MPFCRPLTKKEVCAAGFLRLCFVFDDYLLFQYGLAESFRLLIDTVEIFLFHLCAAKIFREDLNGAEQLRIHQKSDQTLLVTA